MFQLDHIMIETPHPIEAAGEVSERFGLPFAWPLVENEDYSSTGINFGTVNFEFINFRKRFGIPRKSFTGLSGLAFNIEGSEEDAIKRLTALELQHRIGEKIDAHTTITVEEERIFPTLFLVKYHFDTQGWKTRLNKEFHESRGGIFEIEKFQSAVMSQPLPHSLSGEFELIGNGKQSSGLQITFQTKKRNNEPAIIADVAENLEIVLT